jgi:signal transduction histidine kinase
LQVRAAGTVGDQTPNYTNRWSRPLKISRYITEHIEEILAAWDLFAQTLTPAATVMSRGALRDHARQMLLTIAEDIDNAQSDLGGANVSPDPNSERSARSAASIHGVLREDSGFTLVQLTAEFRALRARLLHAWLAEVVDFDATVTRDIVLFNDALDQALAESAVTFSERGNETRDRFLAILGHDLRTPLSAVSMAGQLLMLRPEDASRNVDIAQRVMRSAAMMTAMVNDLLEYSRTQLGGKMPFDPALSDMGDIAQEAVNNARLANPECELNLILQNELSGYFDAIRMQQVIMNLLANAAQYRTPGTAVAINVRGEDDVVTISVTNRGPLIPTDSLKTIFNALVQLPAGSEVAGRPSTSMGLGLFVAREIVLTHGGKIEATSSPDEGTLFLVTLPRARAHKAA